MSLSRKTFSVANRFNVALLEIFNNRSLPSLFPSPACVYYPTSSCEEQLASTLQSGSACFGNSRWYASSAQPQQKEAMEDKERRGDLGETPCWNCGAESCPVREPSKFFCDSCHSLQPPPPSSLEHCAFDIFGEYVELREVLTRSLLYRKSTAHPGPVSLAPPESSLKSSKSVSSYQAEVAVLF